MSLCFLSETTDASLSISVCVKLTAGYYWKRSLIWCSRNLSGIFRKCRTHNNDKKNTSRSVYKDFLSGEGKRRRFIVEFQQENVTAAGKHLEQYFFYWIKTLRTFKRSQKIWCSAGLQAKKVGFTISQVCRKCFWYILLWCIS